MSTDFLVFHLLAIVSDAPREHSCALLLSLAQDASFLVLRSKSDPDTEPVNQIPPSERTIQNAPIQSVKLLDHISKTDVMTISSTTILGQSPLKVQTGGAPGNGRDTMHDVAVGPTPRDDTQEVEHQEVSAQEQQHPLQPL